jgi:cytochrome c553
MSFRRALVLTPLVLAMLAAVPALAQTATEPQADPAAAPATEPATTPAQPAATAPASDAARQQAPSDPAQAAAPATAAPATSEANDTGAAAAPPPPATAAMHGPLFGDASAGEGKAAVCSACHGMGGSSSGAMYPKLAGQNEAYIARQLQLFKTQQPQNPIMMPFAAPLSPQDMHDLGAFFATHSPTSGVADEALLERGQALYRGGDVTRGIPACMACHGPDGRGMAGAGFPQLAGQWADYVSAKLLEWKGGTTWGTDVNAQIMPAIAQAMSEADIAAVSSYVEGLHTAAAAAAKTAGTTAAPK